MIFLGVSAFVDRRFAQSLSPEFTSRKFETFAYFDFVSRLVSRMIKSEEYATFFYQYLMGNRFKDFLQKVVGFSSL